jgi:hypothetical protein
MSRFIHLLTMLPIMAMAQSCNIQYYCYSNNVCSAIYSFESCIRHFYGIMDTCNYIVNQVGPNCPNLNLWCSYDYGVHCTSPQLLIDANVVPNCVGLPPSDPRNCVSKNTITDVNVTSMPRFTTSMVGEDALKVIHESLRGATIESVVDPLQKIAVIHDVDGCPGTTKLCRCGTSVWCSNYCICDPQVPPTA